MVLRWKFISVLFLESGIYIRPSEDEKYVFMEFKQKLDIYLLRGKNAWGQSQSKISHVTSYNERLSIFFLEISHFFSHLPHFFYDVTDF